MDHAVITSPGNPRVKALIALRRRRSRTEGPGHPAQCLVEGRDEFALALRAGVRPAAVYYCPELSGADPDHEVPEADLLAEAARRGAELVRLGRTAFEKAAYRQGPDGILAVVPAPDKKLSQLVLSERPIVIVAQRVEKPGNLGAMLRTADAAGVAALVAADPITDWSNPNVVRASKAAVFAVPVAAATTPETLAWLADQRIPLVATTPDAARPYDALDYRGPVAIAVGAERTGLDTALLAGAAYRVRIPMYGLVDSLNVATAMALVTFEAVRQRRSGR